MKHRHSCSSMSDRFKIITDALYSQGKLTFCTCISSLCSSSFLSLLADGFYRSPADAFVAVNESCVAEMITVMMMLVVFLMMLLIMMVMITMTLLPAAMYIIQTMRGTSCLRSCLLQCIVATISCHIFL